MRSGFSTAKKASLWLVLVFTLVLGINSTVDAIPEIVVTVGDTTGSSGEQNSVITVSLTNTFSEVSAFELWLQLSRPDLLLFQTNLDTIVDTTYWECIAEDGGICVDSVACDSASAECDITHYDTSEVFTGNLDVAGTLISDWQKIETRSISGNGTDIKITALADDHMQSGHGTNIQPQSGGVLFRLLGDIQIVPDTLQDRTVNIYVPAFKDLLSFSDENGDALCLSYEEILDTNYWRCMAWLPPENEVCLDWQRVSSPPYDSIEILPDTVAYLDSNKITLFPGELTVLGGACGDIAPVIDGETDGAVDIADLTKMIDYLFISFTAWDPVPLERGNVDCSTNPQSVVDIGDLSEMINFLFIDFIPFCCSPQ